jgi:hypothetical protein
MERDWTALPPPASATRSKVTFTWPVPSALKSLNVDGIMVSGKETRSLLFG